MRGWWVSVSPGPGLVWFWRSSVARLPTKTGPCRLPSLPAAGSFGQVVGAPTAEWLLSFLPWQHVFVVFAVAILALVLTLPFMRAPQTISKAELEESMSEILGKAFRDPSYALIFLGFFSCGYQLGFITAHFPAFVTEMCGPIQPGGVLHSIGNHLHIGAWCGVDFIDRSGQYRRYASSRLGRQSLLSQEIPSGRSLYGRTIAAALFILFPITPLTVIVFSLMMGSLWLATVPLTSGLVAHLYGLRYMARSMVLSS